MTRTIDYSKNTGIYGGTFDPVHNGHLKLVSNLCRKNLIDQVIFVPTARPPHKVGSTITPAKLRYEMLKLATNDYENFFISDIELDQTKCTYTFDTAEYFSRFLREQLYIVIGTDSLRELSTWYKAENLVRDFKFIIYQRPSYAVPDTADLIRQFGLKSAEKLINSVIRDELYFISSTMVRERSGTSEDIRDLVPATVRDYIDYHRLYTNDHERSTRN